MNNTATKTHISLHKNRLRSQDSNQRTFAQLFHTVGSDNFFHASKFQQRCLQDPSI